MGVKHGMESAYIQERRKWEMRPVLVDAQWVAPQIIDGQHRPGYMDGTYVEPLSREDGGRGNYEYQPYPKMLFKASRADGGPQISDYAIADDPAHEKRLTAQGWVDGQENAIDAIHRQDQEFAKLHANRLYQERLMSPKAQAEANAVDESTSVHTPVIPETPRRGRPRKVAQE